MERPKPWAITLAFVFRLRRYYVYFGFRGVYWALLESIPGSRQVHRRVTIERGGFPIELRLGSTDPEVYGQVFIADGYGLPLCKPPLTLIDAGAYVGLTAIYFAERFPDARIVCLEPDPDNFVQLVKNTSPYPKILPIQAALSGSVGIAAVQPGVNGAWSCSINHHPSEDLPANRPLVPCLTVSSLMCDLGWTQLDLLKLDVEGSEVQIMAHPEEWIDTVEIIAIELHDRLMPGCSRSFFRAVTEFPEEFHSGELTVVGRRGTLSLDQN